VNFPAIPNAHAAAVMALTLLALVLFSRDRIPLESSSLFILCLLAVGFQLVPFETSTGVVQASDFFHGFGHEALVAVCALMIVGQALVRTGALEPVAATLARSWRSRPVLSLLMTLVMGAILSAFVNNTPIVVLMLPVLVNVGLKTNTPVSGTLMPLGMATIIGGMSTTIGTSTNLLVVSVSRDLGVAPFGMFDFALPVVVAGTIGILYLWLIAPRIVPDRKPPIHDTSVRLYSAQIEISEGSPLVGKSLSAAIARTQGEMQVRRIQRGKNLSVTPLPDVLLKAGDVLSIQDMAQNLREFERVLGGAMSLGESELLQAVDLDGASQKMAEVVVMSGSTLDGQRIADARLKSKYGLTLLAIHSAGEVARARTPGLRERVLRSGDILLVQSSVPRLNEVKASGELLVVDGSAELPHTSKAPLAFATLAGVVLAAASGLLPISISALLGCMVLVMGGCLRWPDVAQALSMQVILIIVASLALGSALMLTGGADYIAQVFVAVAIDQSPWVVLSTLILMMTLLTNVVSNNAAAVIGTPIAISIAQRLGMPLEPFVLGVLFGANMSFATPMGYQTNLLVMSAGGYSFMDFVKVGVPLTIIMCASLTMVLTWAYQLY
jgi:di/tricarboxylate transporter